MKSIKPQFQTPPFLIAVIILICTSFGCKKTINPTESFQTAELSTTEIAKAWVIEKKQNQSILVQQGIDSLLASAEWLNGIQGNVSNGKSIIYVPIRNSIVGLEFFYDSKNNIIDSGNIVKIFNRKKDIPYAQILGIQAYYENVILHQATPLFSGTISAFSITNKFLYDYIFDKGKIIAHGIASPKSTQQKLKAEGVKVNGNGSCELWGHYTFWESGAITLDYTWLVCAPGDCLPPSLAISIGGGQYIKINCESGVVPDGGYVGGGAGSGIEAVVIWPGPDKITNILEYLGCFTANGTNSKVKLFINQPNPNTSDVFSLTDVGHSFLSFTQTLPNGTIVTRNVGFYPGQAVSPFNTTAPGELNNDQNSPFNVGLEISVSSSDFMTMTSNVISHVNQHYDLNSINCVNWSMEILLSGGIDLKSGTTISSEYFLGLNVFSGFSPGRWGQTINSMSLSSNMTRFISSSHANTGTCQ